MDIPDVQPHEPAARYADSITKYIVIYVCILALAECSLLSPTPT